MRAGLKRSGSGRATSSLRSCRTSPRRSRRSWRPRRSARSGAPPRPEFGARTVIDRFAQTAEGAARHRRLPVQRPRLRLRREGRGDRGRAAGTPVVPLGYLDGSAGRRSSWARPRWSSSSRACRSTIRSGCSTRAAPRAAQGHRARPRRHASRAAEARPLPRGRPRGRSRLLVLDDRLDDVELPRRRATNRSVDRALRRHPGRRRALGSRRRERITVFGGGAAYFAARDEGRHRARRRPRPLGPARRRKHRLAAVARGVRLDLRAARLGHLAVLHQRRHRRVQRLRRAGCRRCPCTRASCRP